MKKIIIAAMALAMAQAVYAQVDLPYTISFETNVPLGETILTNANCGAWEGTPDVQAYVTNITPPEPSCGYPLPSESHSNVLAFAEGTISNAFNTTAPDPESTTPLEIWLDTLVLPIRQEEEPVGSVTNSQVAVYFDTNGYLNVFHGIIDNQEYSILPPTSRWTKVENGLGALPTNEWARVTIHMKHITLNEMEEYVNQSFFRVFLNGVAFSNDYAFVDADVKSASGGVWFVCAKWDAQKLSTLTLTGSGKIDDLVVSTDAVSFGAANPSVLVSYLGSGIVIPSGTVSFASSPGHTNFNIAASTYYKIAVYQGTVGGSSNAVVEAADKETHELVWSNITGQATLFVQFAPILATNGTPVYWMAGKGLDTNTLPTWDEVALWDEDGDGMLTWEEYVAGTHPDNSNSLLRIVGQTFSNGVPRLIWLSSTEAIAPYMVQMTTNLVGGSWSNVAVNVNATAGGTNVLDVSAPASGPGMYRVTITN